MWPKALDPYAGTAAGTAEMLPPIPLNSLGTLDGGREPDESARCAACKTGRSRTGLGPAEWVNTATRSDMNDGLTLASVLLVGSGLFCLTTLFFGTKGGYYDTDAYDGNGTAH